MEDIVKYSMLELQVMQQEVNDIDWKIIHLRARRHFLAKALVSGVGKPTDCLDHMPEDNL